MDREFYVQLLDVEAAYLRVAIHICEQAIASHTMSTACKSVYACKLDKYSERLQIIERTLAAYV